MVVKFNAELRGTEQKISQKTNDKYLVVHMEDEQGKSFDIMSRNMALLTNYKKGDFLKCDASLVIGKYTKFELISVQKSI